MEKFTQINDGVYKVEGTGSYEGINGDVYIETNDYEVIKYFRSRIRNKKHLSMLELINEDSSTSFYSRYLVESIDGNNPTIIYLKLSS